MALIEGFRISNFRSLKNVTLGKTWNDRTKKSLTPLTVVIGRNGSGKSSLFDAFGFLADSLTYGVEEACHKNGRGGFERLRSAGSTEDIEFEIYYRESPKERPITYELSIGTDETGRPVVKKERLRQRRRGQNRGWPFSFLELYNGEGKVWSGDTLSENTDDNIDALLKEESNGTMPIQLDSRQMLGIATLGNLKEHPRIARFRKFIEGWYLSYFTPDAARDLPRIGPQKHLNRIGDNLGNFVQYMEREHPKQFKIVLDEIAKKIPGIVKIDTESSPDGRLLLRFFNKGFDKPFYAQQISDGTLKLFAYMLLLEDPDPAPFVCIEEPENGLYHKLLQSLAAEFRSHATGKKGDSQLFVTTHQPYFVDALDPEEVWILEKEESGFSALSRASDYPDVVAMYAEGLPLGSLWYSDHIDSKDCY
ncbi:AAA family ATPase [Klebsiella aerogenes]|uniref:AAA family ATPase n=1 Tax=Klebsiella aerogenes TaxID=548 RepID=UPI001CFA20CA|nr:AAA family ATPase [Klebsiella aerogenes]ELA1895366.1 AAA family ATPase [Klebsiella aerogenes]MCB4372573.1 AAA family ATPase [Klebsiella aerogenes]HDS8497173.1 AAA family ATPase [Klebsiella aerogenes]